MPGSLGMRWSAGAISFVLLRFHCHRTDGVFVANQVSEVMREFVLFKKKKGLCHVETLVGGEFRAAVETIRRRRAFVRGPE